ncbi:sensor histidine kinase [Rubrobacter tropicus]|nr:sensor histidine kinase [Rubrobacter tropicus]
MRLLRFILPGLGAGDRPSHAWERWLWAWDLIFYALLAAALVLSLVDGGTSGAARLAAILLSAAWGGLYWFAAVRGRARSTGLMLFYVVAAVAFAIALNQVHPIYQILNFAVFMQVFLFLPTRWSVPVSVSLAVLVAADGIRRSPEDALGIAISGLLTLGFALFLTLWIDSIINQSEERQNLIEELEETRKDLAAAEREAGVLQERSRLAQEIHDTLAQGFVSIVTQLEAADKRLSPDEASVRNRLDRARATAREGLHESRRLVRALRPELLEGASLPEALQRLAARWSEASGTPARLSVTGAPQPLPMPVEVTLLRAAQESLQNVQRHAGARSVDLTLSCMDNLVVLDVHDDGSGFGTNGGDNDDGFGLRAMRERVELLGGRLLIESFEGEGTTVVVEMPIGASGIGHQGKT